MSTQSRRQSYVNSLSARFESLQHASRVKGDWIQFSNHRRPHEALNMKTPPRQSH